MKFIAAALLIAAAGAAQNHPIVKVIKLLEGLKEKSIAEGKEEEVAYSKFQYWCSESISELKDAIANEKETIEELTDKLAGLEKKKESLETEIEALNEQIKENESAAAAAKKLRDEGAALYKRANKDLGDTIDAVEQCIKALEGAEAKTEKGAVLAQQHVKMTLALIGLKASAQQRASLAAFADPKDRPDQLAAGDLAAHEDKYDFKSENVIELLKQLKLKFEDDKLAGTKAETNAINAYDLTKEASDNAHKAASKARDEKEVELKETKSAIADAEKELKSTQDDLEADSASLKDTESACNVKKSEWETRSKTRANEIIAMDMAMKILSESTGVRTEAPGNPVPPPSPVFLQLKMMTNDPKMKAVALLREAASAAHSRALERLAVEVAAHLSGPFDAVNNMIEKMIFRLMDEQKVEDEHKDWCDQEIKKSEVMRDDKEQKIKMLNAEIKDQEGKVGVLNTEIEEAEQMIAEIIKFMADATDVRETGKRENAEAVKDSTQAQASVTNAIAVLEAFYKESGEIAKEPWEFIQKPVDLPKNPATWDASYTAVADPTKKETGIISILEAVLSDFEQMEAETKSQEAQDKKEYDDAMKSNEIEKAGRTQEVEMKTQERARRVDKITSLNGQKKNTEAELEKTEQYLTDLKPACVDGDSSYDDRKAARTTEIVALQKAQVILQDAFKEGAEEKPKSFLQIRSH